MIRWALIAVALLLGACADDQELVPESAGELIELTAPYTPRGLVTRVCRPAIAGPAPLAVINHGSPGSDLTARSSMRPSFCNSEAVRWFTSRGYVAAIPMRRGYGATGGPWAEDFGGCSRGVYGSSGLEAARDILAVIRGMQRRPGVSGAPALVVGQSAGGWGTLALSSLNPPEVGAIVNFAGGRGGWRDGVPNQVCREDHLIEAAGEYGRTARGRTLWIYAANDSFFNHALASRMVAAYRAAGGKAEFFAAPAQGRDGHGLLYNRGGSAVWGPQVASFLGR